MAVTSTRTPRIIQKEKSFQLNKGFPRIQNHCQECSSQVAKKGRHRRHRHRRECAHLPQLEMGRIEEKLHDEVLPVDINTTPEIGEARGEEI